PHPEMGQRPYSTRARRQESTAKRTPARVFLWHGHSCPCVLTAGQECPAHLLIAVLPACGTDIPVRACSRPFTHPGSPIPRAASPDESTSPSARAATPPFVGYGQCIAQPATDVPHRGLSGHSSHPARASQPASGGDSLHGPRTPCTSEESFP